MKLRLYERADAPEVLRLWNTAGAAAGYAPLDAGKLDELLLAHPAFCGESTFVLEERGAILGFAAGCTGDTLAQGAVRGYVSCVLLDEILPREGKERGRRYVFQSPASAVDHPRNGRPPAQQHARHSEGYTAL